MNARPAVSFPWLAGIPRGYGQLANQCAALGGHDEQINVAAIKLIQAASNALSGEPARTHKESANNAPTETGPCSTGLDNDPLVFEFLLHRADEYVQFSHSMGVLPNIHNVYLISPELSIRVACSREFYFARACRLYGRCQHELFYPLLGLELAAVSGRRRGGTA